MFFLTLSIPKCWKGELVVGHNRSIRHILNAFWLYRNKLLSSFSSWNTDNFIYTQLRDSSTIFPYFSAEIPTAFTYTFINLKEAYTEYWVLTLADNLIRDALPSITSVPEVMLYLEAYLFAQKFRSTQEYRHGKHQQKIATWKWHETQNKVYSPPLHEYQRFLNVF